MNEKEFYRTMASDDVLAYMVLAGIGWMARDQHPIAGWIMIVVGVLLCAVRMYHWFTLPRGVKNEPRN